MTVSVPPASKTADLVIFDCDGVLIDSEIISARMLVSELAELGVDIDLPYVARHFLGRSYPVVMAQIRAQFGVEMPPYFEERYRERLLARFEKDLRIMPGVREVMERLDVPFCVATSSSPRRVDVSLRLVGLDALTAGRVYTSTEVPRGKPAPDLFLLAAERMNARPERCLVIEDSLTGLAAAHAAGMTVWRFIGGSHFPADFDPGAESIRPHRLIKSFDQFFEIAPDLRRQA